MIKKSKKHEKDELKPREFSFFAIFRPNVKYIRTFHCPSLFVSKLLDGCWISPTSNIQNHSPPGPNKEHIAAERFLSQLSLAMFVFVFKSLLQRLPQDFDKWPPLHSVLLHLHQQLEPPHKWLLISLLLSGLLPQRMVPLTTSRRLIHTGLAAHFSQGFMVQSCLKVLFQQVLFAAEVVFVVSKLWAAMLSCDPRCFDSGTGDGFNLPHAVIYNQQQGVTKAGETISLSSECKVWRRISYPLHCLWWCNLSSGEYHIFLWSPERQKRFTPFYVCP